MPGCQNRKTAFRQAFKGAVLGHSCCSRQSDLSIWQKWGHVDIRKRSSYKEIAFNRLWSEKHPPAPENYVEYTGAKTANKNNRGQQRKGGGIGAMLLQNDKNKDGLISKEELPERFKAMMVRVDRNQDLVIDKEEIAWMEKTFREERAGSRAQARDPIVYGVAAASGKIIVRTGTRLYCIDNNEQ